MKFCSVCKNIIPIESAFQKIVVCPHCGWVDSTSSDKYEIITHRRYMIVSCLVAIILVTSFIQSVKWGSASIEVIPLQLKAMLNMADPEDYKRMGKICEENHNPACMESAYRGWTEEYNVNDEESLEAHSHLSRALIFNRKLDEASISLGKYFALGGTDLKMAFYYARILSQLDNIDSSIQYFEYVLEEKPKVLQVTVFKAYVSALVKHRKLDQARDVILKLQKSKKSSFMNRELRAIKKELLASK